MSKVSKDYTNVELFIPVHGYYNELTGDLMTDPDNTEEVMSFNIPNKVLVRLDNSGVREMFFKVLYDKHTNGLSTWDTDPNDSPDREYSGIIDENPTVEVTPSVVNSVLHLVLFVLDVNDGMTVPNVFQHLGKVDEDALRLGYTMEDEGLYYITDKGKHLISLIGE